MDLRATPNLVHLSEFGSGRRWLQLDPGRGHRVVAICGEVWITQAGHSEDYVLRAGEALTLQTPGMAMVSPFGSADVEVVAPASATTPGAVPEIGPDVYQRARLDAHQLRAEAMQRMFSAAGAWIGRLARRLLSPRAAS